MKKNTLFTSIFLTASILILTGCQDEIFNEIRDEIELESSTISGHINSIIRYQSGGNEYIVTQNGDINYKLASLTSRVTWTKDKNWSGSASKVAADSSNLYALNTNWSEDVDEGEWVRSSTDIRYKSSIDGSWTTLYTVSGNTAVVLFCTNTPKNANRKAYVRIGTAGVYKLGSTWNGKSLVNSNNTTNATTLPTTSTKSAVYFDSSTYFFDYLASVTNETSSSDATYMYYANGSTIYYSSKGSTWSSVRVGSDSIYSMACTSDYFVLGTDSGLQESALTSHVPGSADSNFSNASSTLSSYYQVWAVLATDPSLTQAENAIYAAIDYTGSSSSTSAVSDNIGLWAYYSSRAKWNRE